MLGDALERTSRASIIHAGEVEDVRPYFCGEVGSRHGVEDLMSGTPIQVINTDHKYLSLTELTEYSYALP